MMVIVHLRRLHELLKDLGCCSVHIIHDPLQPDIEAGSQSELQVFFHEGVHRFFVDDDEWDDPTLADRIAADILGLEGK